MGHTFDHGGLTIRIDDYQGEELKTLSDIIPLAIDAFSSNSALSKRRTNQLVVAPSTQYPIAEIELIEGWQPIRLVGADPYQVLYQFAHELGHVAVGHYRRWRDKNQWIEEVLCGTCSLSAVEHASRYSRLSFPTGAQFADYLDTLKREEFPSSKVDNQPIPVAEFERLVISDGFHESMRPYAGRLLELVNGPEIMTDLPALTNIPSGLSCEDYLTQWSAACADGGRTANAIRQMIKTS